MRRNDGQGAASHPDDLIAEAAERQHGRVARRQLLDLGLSPKEIESRLRSGHLRKERRGVYAVGHRSQSWEATCMSVVLGAGTGAVISDHSAARLWGLIRWKPRTIDVSVPGQLRPRPGVRVHRRNLADDEICDRWGIPATSVARTLFDLAATLDVSRLDRVFNEAEVLGLYGEVSVPGLLRRHPRAPGAARLRRVLELGRTARTLSGLEDLLVGFVRDGGLPMPELNACIELASGPVYVDALWRDRRLVVEMDGLRFHSTARRRAEDRARDQGLERAGFSVLRFTEEDAGHPDAVIDAIRSALTAQGPAPRPS